VATVAEERPEGRPQIEVRDLTRKLGLAAIVGIIFFSVSGGPYGLEDTIGESGPGMGLLLIIITPILWALPASLVVAELATAMPVQGGYYYWVKTALGPFWGFQEGWWSWITSWVDLAIYPVLFVDYTAFFFPALNENELLRWLVALAVIWPFALLNMRGSSLVGDSSKLFLVIVLAPFAIMTVIGLFNISHNPFTPFTYEGVDLFPAFGAGLFVIMWNYMGWDGLSTVAGEIENPRRDYPKAILILIPAITLIYLLPTLVALGVAGGDEIEWTAGAFNVIAENVAGHWLGVLMTFGAIISSIGLYSAWLLQYSRIPSALAEDGYLPESISRLHPRFGTPIRAIVVCAVICSIAALGPFQALVVVDVTIYAFALLLQFIALIALRIKHPTMRRPFRVPWGWAGVVLVTLGPVFVLAVAIYFQVLDVGLVQGIGWALIGMATGPIAYYVLRPAKRRRGIDRTIDLEFDGSGSATEVTR
jgi:amino acid transporter